MSAAYRSNQQSDRVLIAHAIPQVTRLQQQL